jgi:hypothetical protein
MFGPPCAEALTGTRHDVFRTTHGPCRAQTADAVLATYHIASSDALPRRCVAKMSGRSAEPLIVASSREGRRHLHRAAPQAAASVSLRRPAEYERRWSLRSCERRRSWTSNAGHTCSEPAWMEDDGYVGSNRGAKARTEEERT